MYYLAKIKFEQIDSNTGKTKKITEQYLVAADSITQAEQKIQKHFEHSIADNKVVGVQESRILEVINKVD